MKQDYFFNTCQKNSSRLKDKNMIKIKNKFLFEYTLEASLSSKKSMKPMFPPTIVKF